MGADEVGPLEKRSIPQFHPINNVGEWRNVLINILPKSMIRNHVLFSTE